MAYDLDSDSHSVYSVHYHLVLVTKYRRGVLTEGRTNFIHEVIDGFALSFLNSWTSREINRVIEQGSPALNERVSAK